jgi:hypothetical protein
MKNFPPDSLCVVISAVVVPGLGGRFFRCLLLLCHLPPGDRLQRKPAITRQLFDASEASRARGAAIRAPNQLVTRDTRPGRSYAL